MDGLRLTRKERCALERQLRTAGDARTYRRALALLQVAQGQAVASVAATLRIGRRSLGRWLARYRQRPDPQVLADRPRAGRPPRYSARQLAWVDRCLRRPPLAPDPAAGGWTVPRLQAHLQEQGLPPCSEDTLRRYLHALAWSWKRPRYVLAPDPQREKKTPDPSPAQAHRALHRRAF